MLVTKEEWIDWKSNQVTKAFFEACIERVSESKELLVNSAGLDPVNDNFMRGFIAAYLEMFEFKIEDFIDD